MKIGVVTGASSGMGRDFVLAIDKEFHLDEIWVIARREERLKELQNECETKIRVLPWDLQKEESFEKYKELLSTEKPDIKILVNAAGYGIFCTFEETDMMKQLGSIDLNSKALTAMCHLSLPYMKEWSRIVNLGSNSSHQPVPYQAVYGSTKAYVLSFSRALGRELKTRNIQVMCVCPGWIKTEFMETAVIDDTIKYYDRWYESKEVVDKAMKDLKAGKKISILGFPVRAQVKLVKHLPVELVMNIWCKQQGKA